MKTYMRGEFAMERQIRELEQAMTANDEYLQKVEALNAELLAAMKLIRGELSEGDYRSSAIRRIDAAIARAEKLR